MELDFSGLNRIANKAEPEEEKKAALTERGYTVVEGEPLPFDEAPEEDTPARVEIKQIFSLSEVSLFCALYEAGRIELLEKVVMFRKTGALYAHFLLTIGDANKQASEAV